MGLRRSLAVVVALAVLVAFAGCRSRGSEPSPVVTVPEAPATTVPTDPFAVPAVIDEAYVNRVLAALDAAVGDVVRLVVKTRTFPPEAYDRLKAVYGDPEWLQLAVDGFQDDLRNGLVGYQPAPGNKVSTVSRLVTAKPTCVFAEVARDFSAVRPLDQKLQGEAWVGLRATPPSSYNPTRWVYIYNGFSQDRSQPPDPCAGSL